MTRRKSLGRRLRLNCSCLERGLGNWPEQKTQEWIESYLAASVEIEFALVAWEERQLPRFRTQDPLPLSPRWPPSLDGGHIGIRVEHINRDDVTGRCSHVVVDALVNYADQIQIPSVSHVESKGPMRVGLGAR